ncbi:hypothetical protein P692DRAFT_20738713, partial [Suillus brevipes Sb2]
MSIPRSTNSKLWALFALAHFKPFSNTVPLVPDGTTVEHLYETYSFSQRSKSIMQHWEAVHECEDERDADRLRKQARLTGPKTKSTAQPHGDDADEIICGMPDSAARRSCEQFRISQTVLLLTQARWLNGAITAASRETPSKYSLMRDRPDDLTVYCTPKRLKEWMDEVKKQEEMVATTRRNALNP